MKTRLALIVGLVAALPGMAGAQQALTFDAFASADADHNRVRKAGLSFDWSRIDNADYRGIRLEDAMSSPAGGDAEHSKRIYYRFADRRSDGTWSWKGMLGTDGHTWLGNASVVRESDWRQEFFLERAAVETARGIEERLHYTFAGAAFDLPVDERNVFTALAGVQDFSGRNLRQHLRARYIRVLSETHGLSFQVRLRYAHDRVPHEYDYFSPRWYARAIPMLQWRRFRGGWQYRVAAGVGRQADADSGWRAAQLLEASVTSPADQDGWWLRASTVHTNEPSSFGNGYRYTQAMLTLGRRF